MHARVLTAICVLLATVNFAQSRRWFAREVNCWITQKKVPASWEDAHRRCGRYGAVLASPLNTQLYNYLQSRINVYNDSAAYFIGTRATRSDDGQDVSYVSVEGRLLDDMPMAVFDAIKQLDLEQGDCLSMDGHRIRAVSCWDHLPYICYSNETAECGSALAITEAPTSSEPSTTASTVTTSTSTALPTSTIPPGYTYYPATGSAYKIHDTHDVTWDDANTTCAGEGAHLLVLNNAQEADIVARIVGDAVGDYDYRTTWTGLRDNRPGGVMEWRTVHGEPLSDVYHVWDDGRPLNDAEWTCAVFGAYDKRLYDEPCDDSSYYYYIICEISQKQ